MTRRARMAFFAVVGAQVLLPLGIVGYNELKLATGTTVRLHVQPVDPVDFFRGEYVALNYDISTIRVEGDPPPGTTVYVPLFESDGRWVPSRFATTERPPDDNTFIRGHKTDRGIEYGIETYFVEEGQARKYEQAMGRGDLFADVVVDGDGDARIKRLRVISQG
jgi:uncharacterized membrane-anchored protein